MQTFISGVQIPSLARLNIDGGLTLSASAGTSGQLLISQGAGVAPVWTSSPNLNNPLLTAISTVGGGGAEGGQINFARVSDGTAYWYIDSFGTGGTPSGSAPDLRFIENATERFRFASGGALYVNGSAGTSGQVLTSAGTSASPTWTTVSGGSLGYIANYQTTAAAVTTGTITIGGTTLTTGTPLSLSFLGGNTTGTTGNGGSINLTGGNATNTTTINSGGSIYITGGNGNSTQGVGGNVQINGGAGSGPSNNGNGAVFIGNSSNTDAVYLGISGRPVSFNGNISIDGSSPLLTSANSPGVLGISNLYLNFNGTTGVNQAGQFSFIGNTFQGWQTSTGAGRIPAMHTVFSLANSSSSTSGTATSAFAAVNDVLSSLEAGKLYRFRATYYSSFTYAGVAGTISLLFAFSNAPTAIKYTFKTYSQTASATPIYFGVGTTTAAVAIAPSQSANAQFVTEVEGYFTTHATLASTFTPQFSQSGSSSTTLIQAGSFIEIEKLGTSTQTLIAGNWA